MAEGLTYQEILRTLGALLEHSGCKSASLGISLEGAQISAPLWPWPRDWDADAIAAQAAVQRSLRLHPYSRKIVRAGKLSRRLRLVGAALDVDNSGPYVVIVEPSIVRAEGRNGYRRTFEPKPLSRRERLAPHLRGQLSAS